MYFLLGVFNQINPKLNVKENFEIPTEVARHFSVQLQYKRFGRGARASLYASACVRPGSSAPSFRFWIYCARHAQI